MTTALHAHLIDWLALLLRWAHVIAAIAWIGASFHFVAVDNSLTPPEDDADRDRGVGGERWAVHGGGFYHQQKYLVSPPHLPARLHWSMWESYTTWLTGFALFSVVYLAQAGTYLVDKSRFDWPAPLAAGVAVGGLLAFWLVYDGLCRLFGERRHGDRLVGGLVALLVVAAAWAACQLYAGRAACLLVGAMMASAMSANVLFWIIPGQRRVVAALRAGKRVDPVHGRRGKQRSVHNTYFTLPVLPAMLSHHFSGLAEAPHNWLWLVLLMAGGALIRSSFVQRHGALAAGRPVSWTSAIAGVALVLGVVVALAPRGVAAPSPGLGTAPPPAFTAVRLAEVQAIVGERCMACHNAAMAQKGVALHTPALIAQHAQRVYQQTVVSKAMPLNNATGITDAEREVIRRWFEAGAPAEVR